MSETCICCGHERNYDKELEEWEPSYCCPCCDEYVCEGCWNEKF